MLVVLVRVAFRILGTEAVAPVLRVQAALVIVVARMETREVLVLDLVLWFGLARLFVLLEGVAVVVGRLLRELAKTPAWPQEELVVQEQVTVITEERVLITPVAAVAADQDHRRVVAELMQEGAAEI
jgi:hypothetical protein